MTRTWPALECNATKKAHSLHLSCVYIFGTLCMWHPLSFKGVMFLWCYDVNFFACIIHLTYITYSLSSKWILCVYFIYCATQWILLSSNESWISPNSFMLYCNLSFIKTNILGDKKILSTDYEWHVHLVKCKKCWLVYCVVLLSLSYFYDAATRNNYY